MRPIPGFSSELVETILDRAIHTLDTLRASSVLDRAEFRANAQTPVLALCFVIRAAVKLPDPQRLEIIQKALSVVSGLDWYAFQGLDCVQHGIAGVLTGGAPVDSAVQEWARHEKPELRGAVARGLQLGDAEAIALMDKLSQDPDGSVRMAAKRRLQAFRDLPWWLGKFTADPTAALDPATTDALQPTFEALCKILDGPDARRYPTELAQAVGGLPDHLLFDLVGQVVRPTSWSFLHAPVLGVVMERPAGRAILPALLVRILGTSDLTLLALSTSDLVRFIPEEHRAETSFALARAAFAQPRNEDEEDDHKSIAAFLASFAVNALPVLSDAGPYLAFLEERWPLFGASEHSAYLLGTFLEPLKKSTEQALRSAVPKLAEARVSGYSGAWKTMSWAVDEVLAKMPARELRGYAERALDADDERTVEWGLLTLLRGHDPERDSPPLLLAADLFAHPKIRLAALKHVEYFIPSARVELRELRLELGPAMDLMQCLLRSEKKLVPVSDAFIEPGPPPSHEEWQAYREIRQRSKMDRLDWMQLLDLVQTGEDGDWLPEDRKLLEKAMDELEDDDSLGFMIAAALKLRPPPDVIALLTRVIRATHPTFLRPVLKNAQEVRLRLGLGPEVEARFKEAADYARDRFGDEEDWDDD
ncbi:MAG: hypothetical protein HY791_34095 [Deltaproteobacteria bacterium]|nr:hypothetical protein [Deltaproteobacteria bacterium]